MGYQMDACAKSRSLLRIDEICANAVGFVRMRARPVRGFQGVKLYTIGEIDPTCRDPIVGSLNGIPYVNHVRDA